MRRVARLQESGVEVRVVEAAEVFVAARPARRNALRRRVAQEGLDRIQI